MAQKQPTRAAGATSTTGDTKPLPPKQRLFIEAYISNGFNATQAAITAGYSEKTAYSQGSRLLKNVEVKNAIQQRMKEAAMSADEALYRLSLQAAGSMEDFLDVEGNNIDLVKADKRGKLHLIKEFTHTVTSESDRITIKLYDAQTALAHVLREQHLRAGEPTERTEITDKLSDEDRAARVAALLEKAKRRAAGDGDTTG